MKRLTLLLGGLAAAGIIALVPLSSRATIIGSKHDFTSYTNYWIGGVAPGLGYGGSTNVCGECHTMHHANPDRVAPLWDHATTLQTFTVYNSPTFNGGTPTIDGSSRACLSCHDGSLAINQTYNAYGTNTYAGSAVYIAGSAIIPDGSPANDLRNVHPVGFSYDTAAAADPDLNPIGNTVPGVSVGNIGTVMLKGPTHRVECSSCHDIHRTKGASSSGGIYTIVSTKNSQLCLTCHNK